MRKGIVGTVHFFFSFYFYCLVIAFRVARQKTIMNLVDYWTTTPSSSRSYIMQRVYCILRYESRNYLYVKVGFAVSTHIHLTIKLL